MKENKINDNFDIIVAKCGRSIGLKGEINLIIYTDFLEIFSKGNVFKCGETLLTLESFNKIKGSAKFKEISNIDLAKELNSHLLYSSRELTREHCELKNNEFFWFDIVGLKIFDNDELIGEVGDIQRFGNVDYLAINVESNINKKYNLKAKSFLIPYIERYIIDTNLALNRILVRDSIPLLEES